MSVDASESEDTLPDGLVHCLTKSAPSLEGVPAHPLSGEIHSNGARSPSIVGINSVTVG